MGVQFLLNGARVEVETAPTHATLLDFLRSRGLTGAKEGCAEGECGACTVAMVGADGQGSAFRPVNSCLLLLPTVAGQEIYTVESLALNGRLSEVQQAMAAAGGSQCGYCTPGFVMSLFAEQYRPGRSGRCEVEAMAGNLCRCTGYRPIRDAAYALGPAPDDAFRHRLNDPAPRLAPFDGDGVSRPSTIAECLAALARHPGARLVAGGTDLAVEANLRHTRWPHLVSLEGIDALREIVDRREQIELGAALTLSEIGRGWPDAPAVLAQWLTLFASPPIRNRATLGGNLATASPIGDAAPLLLALDASVRIDGPHGRRTSTLSTFFTGYRKTQLQAGELVSAVILPKPLPQVIRFYKVAKRPVDDISTVAVALAIDRDAQGRVRRARFAFGGVAATPVRVIEAERAVEGRMWDAEAVRQATEAIGRTLTPMSDHRGSKEYRLAVAMSLVEKFWWESQP